MAEDEWTLAGDHPVNKYSGMNTPDAGDMTLQELMDWANNHGHALSDVSLEYGGCGSHAIELWVGATDRHG